MGSFSIRIAGHTALVHALFDSTAHYCRRYGSGDPPEFSLEVTKEDLLREQETLRREALSEGLKPRLFPEPFLERSVIQRKLAERLFPLGIFLFHGSTLAFDDRAYLFTAACGTGKSTHTRLWRQVFGDRVQMVNDDKPFLELRSGGVLAHGSPWSGKHGLDNPVSLPLAGICVLTRGTENTIRPLPAREALPFLSAQLSVPEGADPGACLAALSQDVPLWQMECTRSPQAAELARAAMVDGESERKW